MFTFNAMCSAVETADKSTHQESQSVDVYGKHRNLVGINKIVACICTTFVYNTNVKVAVIKQVIILLRMTERRNCCLPCVFQNRHTPW